MTGKQNVITIQVILMITFVHFIKKNIIMVKNNVVFTPDQMLGSEAFRQATNFIKISDKFYYC